MAHTFFVAKEKNRFLLGFIALLFCLLSGTLLFQIMDDPYHGPPISEQKTDILRTRILNTSVIPNTLIPNRCRSNNTGGHTQLSEVDKIFAVDNAICKVLFPSRLEFLVHHKCGVFLSSGLMRRIKQFCHIYYFERDDGQPNVEKYHNWRKYIPFSQTDEAQQHIFIHFVRDPVLTIISAFHYHQDCKEKWVHRPFLPKTYLAQFKFWNETTDLLQLNTIYLHLMYQCRQNVPFWSNMLSAGQRQHLGTQRNVDFKRIRWLYVWYSSFYVFSTRLLHGLDYIGFHIEFNDTKYEAYNMVTANATLKPQYHGYTYMTWMRLFANDEELIEYGLYFELLRYLFLIFPQIYARQQQMRRLGFNAAFDVRMEDWNSDFSLNANKILDALNVIDSTANRDLLAQNGLANVNISRERRELFGLFSKESPANRQNDPHIHLTRNNTKYIHSLLSIDRQICLLLKYVTNLIDYRWNYTRYC